MISEDCKLRKCRKLPEVMKKLRQVVSTSEFGFKE